MKKYIKKILVCFLVIGMSIISGFVLLCLAHSLPTDNIHKNIQSFVDRAEYIDSVDDYISTRIDTYTDSIMLNEAACPVEAPIIEKAIFNYQVTYFKQYSQEENLTRYLSGEEGYDYTGYSHYWGGHQVFLKIMLQFLDYSDLKMLNLMLQSILFVLIIIGFSKKGYDYVIPPFAVTILSIVPSTIAVCFQYSSVYYVTLLGTALLVWYGNRIKRENVYLLFLVLGIITSYIDFLTYPLITLGIPLIVVMVMYEESKWMNNLQSILFLSFTWGLGYIGMWSGKWILGSLLLPESGALSEAIRALKYRGSNEAEGKMLSLLDVLMENAYIYIKWPLILIVGLYIAGAVVKGIKNHKLRLGKIINYLYLLFPSVYPIVWFLVSRNHSFQHAFMTYRILAISLFAGLCFISSCVNNEVVD